MGTELAKANNELAIRPPVEIIEKLVAYNDLKELTPHERLAYYNWRCNSIGVDPAAQPFEYLELDKKLVLYPKAYLADQLRNTRKISVRMGDSKLEHGIYTIVATASDADGRVAENVGAVPCIHPDQIKEWYDGHGGKRSFRWVNNPKAGQLFTGVELANAIKKATTQAQRRATFSLVGLGGQDTDDVEGVQRLDVSAMHDPKGLLPSDHPPEEPEKKEQPVPSGPVNWQDDDQWPAGDPSIATMKLVGVRLSANGSKRWITTTWDDGCGEIQAVTWHLSSEQILASGVGRLFDVMYMRKGNANQLLSAKEVTK